MPASVEPAAGVTFTLGPTARIGGDVATGEQLAALLRPATGFELPVVDADGPVPGGIALLLGPGGDAEAYDLDIGADGVVVRAATRAGLHHGVQTLRQLLPVAGPWTPPGGRIRDHPRFGYRGAMLDVARHFHPVATVKRFVDLMALYKMNHLHLHLSDDQGWRLAIDSWPRLTELGGATGVGDSPGGFYTAGDYAEIVAYAARNHVAVVPEIDMPGHTNAALAAYPELTCDGVAPPPYTGTGVGFSSLCTTSDTTYTFVGQVLAEVAALSPGPYLHIGGDEADATPADGYAAFLNRVQPIVTGLDRTVIGWHQIAASGVDHCPGRILQYWGRSTTDELVRDAVVRGARVLMSPSDRAYLDMKYTPDTPIGLDWAGHVDVDRAYDWDPGTYLDGVPEEAVAGVEAPLWTETVRTADDIDLLTFPRLPAIAELGWSPRSTHDWESFRRRLATHGPRWDRLGVRFHRSQQVRWPI